MEAIYLDDAYVREFEGKVVKVVNAGGGKYITILDRTAFYPAGGGQPHDTGFLLRNGEEFRVIFVEKMEEGISHEVDRDGLQEGDIVNGKIDWNRRYRLMRMHTAAHLLASIIHDKAGALITGNQLGEEQSRIDFSLEEFDKDKILSYIEDANNIIKKDLPVKFYWLSREDALQNPEFFKLAKGFSHEIEKIRIVEIEGVDKQADGGCHVSSLSEIGKIEFLRAENKGKSNRRVYYALR